MTTTARNEAAERLLEWMLTAENAAGETHPIDALDEALAAERRATVERIRERLAGMEGGAVLLTVASFSAILDEEAAR